jgi:hypothetical protein
MTDNDTLERRLRELGSHLDVPAGDPLAAMARGRGVRRRNRALAAMATTAALATAVAGVGVAVRATDHPAPVAAAGSGPGHLGNIGIDWQVLNADRASSILGGPYNGSQTGSGPLYAVSTGAGETESPGDLSKSHRVLWRSDDGIAWSAVATLGNGLFAADLAQAGQRLYAVGTGEAQHLSGPAQPVSAPVAGWSDDGGKTWQHADLPIDLASMAARSARIDVVDEQVVASPLGTLAVATVSAVPDLAKLVPAGVSAADGWAYALDGSGIDVLGPRPAQPCGPGDELSQIPAPGDPTGLIYCNPSGGGTTGAPKTGQELQGVARHFTWDELGITGDFLTAVQSRPFAFLAAPGSTDFLPVPATGLDPDPADPPVQQIRPVAVPDGLVAAVWFRAGGPTERQQKVALVHSTDGRTWQTLAMPPGMTSVESAGEFDGALWVSDGGRVARVGSDGSWTVTNLAELLGDNPDSGYARVAISDRGIAAVFGSASGNLTNGDSGDDHRQTTVLVTRDGLTWQDWDFGTLIGHPPSVMQEQVGFVGDQVVIGVLIADPNTPDGQPYQPIALIGTPR